MDKDKKIERLERLLAKLREENQQLKSDVRKAKKDSSKANKKRCQDNNIERRTRKVVVSPVRGHKFSELAIKLATVIYPNVGCGLRSVVKLLEIIDDTFDGVFQGELPSHTEISNWAKKNGLATYMESGKRLSGLKYCEIHVQFDIPCSAFREGENILAIRLYQSWGGAYLDYEITSTKGLIGSVESLVVTAPKSNTFYDLTGRKVTKPQRGIYIYGGKKVIIE